MNDKKPAYRVGVDVGGTFTDLVVRDEARDDSWFAKTLNSPSGPARAVLAGIERLGRSARSTSRRSARS